MEWLRSVSKSRRQRIMSHFSTTLLFKKLAFAVPCPSGQAESLANGLLITNIKVRLDYELKFINLVDTTVILKTMKKLKLIGLMPLAMAFGLVTTITSSCEYDQPTPEYDGKWLTQKTVAVSAGFTKSNYTLEITDNRFTETFFEGVYQYKYPEPGTFVSIEGSISVSDSSMKFTPAKISFSSFYFKTSVLSAPYKVYSGGDPDFQTIFNSLDWPTCKYQVAFSVENDKLILKADKDSDGLFTGFDETTTYTKQAVLEVKAPPPF